MTLEETQRRNDELRTMFKGGRVLMTSTVYEQLPAEIRGRMLYRLTLFNHFHPESDHSEVSVRSLGILMFGRFNSTTTNELSRSTPRMTSQERGRIWI
jgi:hypothetical protein